MVIQAPPSRKINSGPNNGPNRKSPVASIASIACLKRYDNRDYALDLLHDLARAVGPVMHHFNFKVGLLCEMYPKNPQLLGLNVNHGQKILIRLRPPYSENSFYPMSDLVGTMLHELAHNVHGPHDAKFYALLDELRAKYDARDVSASDYVCEENRLGAGYVAPWKNTDTVRQKRLEALSKGKYKAEARRLGGAGLPVAMREAMLRAAEQRARDSKWCLLNIVDVGDDEIIKTSMETESTPEVVDLTGDDEIEGDGKGKKEKTIDATKRDTGKGDASKGDASVEIIEVDA